MGIDKETKLSYINIWVNKGILKEAEKRHIEEVGEDEHKEKPQLVFTNFESENFKLNTDELYFEKDTNEIFYCGSDSLGNSVSFNLPLSDILLIDVLEHAIKKFNKLKIAMESLK